MNATIEQRLSDAGNEFTVRLDDLQRALPAIPAKALEMARAGVRRVNDLVTCGAHTISERVTVAGDTAGPVAEQRSTSAPVVDVTSDRSNLSTMTKAELYERAQALEVEGRSGMSKAELLAALRRN